MKYYDIFLLVIIFFSFAFSQEYKKLNRYFFPQDKKEIIEVKKLSPETKKHIIPLLITQLENPKIAKTVKKTLYSIGADVIPPLIKNLEHCLKEKNYTLKMHKGACIIEILELFGKEAKNAIPVLLETIQTDDLLLSSISSLGKIAPDSTEVANYLIFTLEETYQDPRFFLVNAEIISSLSLFSIRKQDISEIIEEFIKKTEETLFLPGALNALGNLGTSFPVLMKFTSHKNSKIREATIRAMGKLILQKKDFYPQAESHFLKALNDEELEVAYSSSLALQRLNKREEEILPVLLKAFQKGKDFMKANALIATMDPIFKKQRATILSHLTEGLERETNELLLLYILYALGELKAKEIAPKLINFLKHENRAIAYQTAAALVAIVPERLESVPILLKALEDPSEKTRTTALNLLETVAKYANRKK